MFAIFGSPRLIDRWTNEYYLDDKNILQSTGDKQPSFGERHYILGCLISMITFSLPILAAAYFGITWLFLVLAFTAGGVIICAMLSMLIAYPSLYNLLAEKRSDERHKNYLNDLDNIVKNVKPARHELVRNGKSYRYVTAAYPSVAKPMDNWVKKAYDLHEAGANVLPAKDLTFVKKSIDSGWDLISNYDALPLESKQGDSKESELLVKKLNELTASYEPYLNRANDLRREKFEASASAVDKLVGSGSASDEV
jgi:hypothetical protein